MDAQTSVTQSEIEWMLSKRALVYDRKLLDIDHGAEEAEAIVRAFNDSYTVFLPCLNYPGVSTRWKAFKLWLE